MAAESSRFVMEMNANKSNLVVLKSLDQTRTPKEHKTQHQPTMNPVASLAKLIQQKHGEKVMKLPPSVVCWNRLTNSESDVSQLLPIFVYKGYHH
jgi:hypothetical protein